MSINFIYVTKHILYTTCLIRELIQTNPILQIRLFKQVNSLETMVYIILVCISTFAQDTCVLHVCN
jgi:hypothetical protein